MFEIGERVVYGFHSVCRVVDLEERIVDRKKQLYMVLEQPGQGSARFYVPTHNDAAMAKVKRMLTRQELEDLLNSDTVRNGKWISEENHRKLLYRELISKGDREKLMQMVRCIYIYKAEQAALGKRCHMCDENFLRDAEKLLCAECSIILDLEPEEARRYLRSRLSE